MQVRELLRLSTRAGQEYSEVNRAVCNTPTHYRGPLCQHSRGGGVRSSSAATMATSSSMYRVSLSAGPICPRGYISQYSMRDFPDPTVSPSDRRIARSLSRVTGARSTRERGRSRFPLREPIGLRPRGPAAHTQREREGNDPDASPCPNATDCARNPKTSRADPRVAVFAERRSSPGIAGGPKPGGSAAESMRSYRAIALDRCPAQPVRRCSRRPR